MRLHSLPHACLFLLFVLAGRPTPAQAEARDAGTASSAHHLDLGRRLAVGCAECHALRPGDSARWGPSLVGVLGRTMGAEPGYRYGSYLRGRRDAAATWDDAAFRRWVVGSKAVARDAGARTKMPAQELSEADLDALIAFLRTVK